MRYLSQQLISPPIVEPVTLELAKQHLRVSFTDDDSYISLLITAAREYCESVMYRKIFNQTWTRTLDYFPIWLGDRAILPSDRDSYMLYSQYWTGVSITLPGQIQSVTSIQYHLPNGQGATTLNTSFYDVDLTSRPARLVPAMGYTWPTQELYIPGSVTVTYTAGSYGDGVASNTCPQSIVFAILLMIGHLYDNRSSVTSAALKETPMAVSQLLAPYSLESFYVQ